MKQVITGNHAVSHGVMLSRVQVISAYPITPQTEVVEMLSTFCAQGRFPAKFIKVESEHSAMAACIGASSSGVRTFTATSSQGLALMHELLHWAAGQRTPVVMGVINRAVGPPWNIWADHTDSMAQRDTNWIQIYAENNQEVLDMVIQAYRVGEEAEVSLPVMIMEDAFYLSHTAEPVEIPHPTLVDAFLPPFLPERLLDVDEPLGFNVLAGPDLYEEFRYGLARAMEAAARRIPEVDAEFEQAFGRSWGGLLEVYRCDDAEVVLMAMGTAASTGRVAVDALREEGIRAGLMKVRFFRPFPRDAVRRLGREVDALAILDRSFTGTYGGPLYTEVAAALEGLSPAPVTRGFYAGVGGRDLPPQVLRSCLEEARRAEVGGVTWADLRAVEEA